MNFEIPYCTFMNFEIPVISFFIRFFFCIFRCMDVGLPSRAQRSQVLALFRKPVLILCTPVARILYMEKHGGPLRIRGVSRGYHAHLPGTCFRRAVRIEWPKPQCKQARSSTMGDEISEEAEKEVAVQLFTSLSHLTRWHVCPRDASRCWTCGAKLPLPPSQQFCLLPPYQYCLLPLHLCCLLPSHLYFLLLPLKLSLAVCLLCFRFRLIQARFALQIR